MRRLPVVQPGAYAVRPPLFEKIGIVGLGLVGGSLALACRARWPGALVIGVDHNDVLERAMVRHAVDVGADDLGMLAEADLVVLAAPVAVNRDVLRQLPDHVRGEAIVTDVGSSKRDIVAIADGLPPRLRFVGGHPFAGAAQSGIEHGTATLFERRPWFLTPVPSTDPAVLERVSAFVEGVGATPHVLTAEEHDRLLAALSHVPQIIASILMQVVGDRCGEEGLALAGRGLRDTTRLAASAPAIWADVLAANADHVRAVLDEVLARLGRLRADLDDRDAVTSLFESAQAWKAILDRSAPPSRS